MKCLIAPVPVVHLPSALDVFRVSPEVAFATEKGLWFLEPKTGLQIGMDVFIIATKTGLTEHMSPPLKVGHAVLRGTYLGFTGAVGGRHPNPQKRPVSTYADSQVSGFFEVGELLAIAPIPVSKFKSKSGKTMLESPRGPMIAFVNDVTIAT